MPFDSRISQPLVSTRGGPEAFYADEPLPVVGRADIDALKRAVPATALKRSRLCLHSGAEDQLHEMFIVLSSATYIRPHLHRGKVESLLVLEGEADAVFFDEGGEIDRAIRLSDYRSGGQFFYRIAAGIFHTLVLRSETLVFQEATLGPFDRSDTVMAPWSPDQAETAGVRRYVTALGARVDAWKGLPR